MNTAKIIRSICGKDDSHWKFLMALSYLEHIGHQKLLKYKKITGEHGRSFLQHLAKEAGHMSYEAELFMAFITQF